MTIGELLEKVLEWLSEFWPIRRISDWEQGVLVRAGKIIGTRKSNTGLFGTGFHVLVPFLHELIVEDSNIDAEFSPRLDLITIDGKPISLLITVQYVITDMATMWRSIQDYEDSVMAAICSEVVETGLDMECAEIPKCLCMTALIRCREVIEPWGVHIKHLGIASLTTSKVLRLIGNDE
jgi:hypothetical protein